MRRLPFLLQAELARVEGALPGLEEALAPFFPRPHWGKMFTMPLQTVQERYARLPAFRSLLNAHDPGGKFRNAFVERNVFGQF